MEGRFNIEFWDNLFSHCEVTGQEISATSSHPVKFSGLDDIPILILTFLSLTGQVRVKWDQDCYFYFVWLEHVGWWLVGWLVRSTTIYCRQRRDPILCDQGQYKQPYCHRDASYYNKHKHSLHSTGFGLARSNQIQIWQQPCLHVLRSNIYTNRDQFAI